MENLFEIIINNLRDGNSISEITNDIKLVISNGNLKTSDIILAFIQYLNSNYLNENNSETFKAIESYISNQVSLEKLSQELFLKKVVVDQDKRDGHQPQFRHKPDETFLDEIFRVIFEFTRNDITKPKGVCFDFCLFITGLSIAKKDQRKIYIWNSIERSSGENNFILFCEEGENVLVYDPFNGVYLPIEKYDIAGVGFRLIELNDANILKVSSPLTGFDYNPENIVYYNQIQELFKSIKSNKDEELELMKKQNYYQRLGVNKNATFEEIKSSFRKLISKYHPDINPDDRQATAKTQLIIEAYDCLKSDALRKEYDSTILENTTTKPEQEGSANTATPNSEDINFDEEIEKIIREFKKKYHVNSYEEILEVLTRMTRQKVKQESCREDLKHNNYLNIINKNNYDIDNIDNIDYFNRSHY